MLGGSSLQICRRSVVGWLCSPLLFATLPSWGESTAAIAQLQQIAVERQLHQQRTWQVLLHYQPTLFGVESLIDDRDFFLAADGKQNPEAELQATIAALFEQPADPNQAPQCRFIARHHWLRQQLADTPAVAAIPRLTCGHYEELKARVAPNGVTLIFPTAHINSPASMFGHTLLRFDSSRTKSPLLSFAVNYAAQTEENNGLLFAIRGLTGLYEGYFSLLRYSDKLKEYSSTENRDIWEYPLNLTAAEVEQLFNHLWELDQIAADYYFFTENCSYQLLTLIEAARPQLQLIDHFTLQAIPVDTIRLLKEERLLTSSHYRPSNVTQIHRLEAELTKSDQDQVVALIDGAITPATFVETSELEPLRQQPILDLAVAMTHYRFSRREYDQATFQRRYLPLLKARSGLGLAVVEEPPRMVADPIQGHLSKRLAVGIGRAAGEPFSHLALRPAYHDLLDAPLGYQVGAAINFFDLELRHYTESNQTKISRFTPLEIHSLAPISPLIHPLSWQVRLSWEELAPESSHYLSQLRVAGGYSRWVGTKLIAFGLLEQELTLASVLEAGYRYRLNGVVGLHGLTIMDRIQVAATLRQPLATLPTQEREGVALELAAQWSGEVNRGIRWRSSYRPPSVTLPAQSGVEHQLEFRYHF